VIVLWLLVAWATVLIVGMGWWAIAQFARELYGDR
jgi:hypothetical protein